MSGPSGPGKNTLRTTCDCAIMTKKSLEERSVFMAVRVGSARHDENGKLKGGKPGDQTGVEVSTQDWYLHKKGWVVIRPKDPKVRAMIARDMEWACENPNIGYDQSQNYTLYNEAKKYGFNCSMVKTPCETDCSRLVRVCLAYAGIHVPTFYTGNEVEVLKKTGKFDILTSDKYCTSGRHLIRGDILVTKVTGHTVIVLSNGEGGEDHLTLKEGSEGAEVSELQNYLNQLGYPDNSYNALKVDGKFGERTEQAVKRFQRHNDLNVDGICGPKTWAKIEAELKEKPKKVETLRSCVVHTGPKGSYKKKAVIKKGVVVEWSIRENNWLYLPRWNGWISGLKSYTKTV